MTADVTIHAALDRRLSARSPAPIALGLSGGGDSLALMLLTKAWADRHGRRLLAFTVDHGLSPDSPRWTAFAGEAAARAGVVWRALTWTGAKPAAGLPAAARTARHRLLADAAREACASVILLGHTADDAAESALMREADAPGLGRLREWGPSPVWPEGRGLFLLRPMLGLGRTELRELLKAAGWSWLDDPANDDPRFARARARARLSARPLTGEGWACGPAWGPKGTRAPLTPILAGPLPFPPEEVEFTVTPDGRILAARGGLAPRFVSAALLCAGGGNTPPRGPRLARLVERLAAGESFSASLAGARVTADAQGVLFGREAGERLRGGLAAVEAEPGTVAIWDGRYEVRALETGWRVEALAGRVSGLSRAERAFLKSLPPPARSALPVLVGRTTTLPRPFSDGPAMAKSLVGQRLFAACGLLDREQEPSS
jgi:tRNA(Ile)-lysidine synthase